MVIAFKLLHWYITIEIDLMVDIGLTRKEKEKLVIDLYKRGLTYAQIAKEVHVSLRDIAPILNKTGEYQSLSNSSQAYKMFEEGSSPIQVAIALNLRRKPSFWISNVHHLRSSDLLFLMIIAALSHLTTYISVA